MARYRKPAQRSSLAAPVQRALGLYLPGNDLMLHVAVGPEAEGERQMLLTNSMAAPGRCVDPGSGLPGLLAGVQALLQRGIDFVIRRDSSWGAAREFLRSGHSEGWRWLWPL